MRISDWSSDVCSSDLQPGLREATATMLRDQLGDTALVRFRGRRREGQGDFTQPEIEQAVAASRLAIIVALRCCPAQYLDLAGVKAEPFVNARDLRLAGALDRKSTRLNSSH